jgi:hypothetical protein
VTLVVSVPNFLLGRSPFPLLSELEGRRALSPFWECVAEIQGQRDWVLGQGSWGPHPLTYSSSYNGDGQTAATLQHIHSLWDGVLSARA